MVAQKVIRHYVIKDEQTNQSPRKQPSSSIPTVIKSKRVDEGGANRIIDASETAHTDQPTIELHKDDHGILTAIDVKCACGQSFTIKLEYE